MDRQLFDIYSQSGAGYAIPHFSGYRKHQIGGGFLGGLLRMIIPLFKSFGKSVGKSALNVGAKTAHDMAHGGGDFKEIIKKNLGEEISSKLDKSRNTIFNKKRKK